MNIYKVSRHDHIQYDQYDSFVCYAKNEDSAEKTLPRPVEPADDEEEYRYQVNRMWTTDPANIYSEYLGSCLYEDEEKVILASFNCAG